MMKRPAIALCASLIVAAGVTSTPFDSARGQGLVEYALVLVFASVAADEINEFAWYPRAGRGRGDAGGSNVEPIDTFTYVISDGNSSGDTNCRQSLDAQVRFGDGINGMRVQVGPNGESLWVNGELVGLLDECFLGQKRFFIEIGVTLPPAAARGLSGPGPMPAPPGLTKPTFLSSSVISPDGATLVRSTCGDPDRPYVVLKVPNPSAY
jgi:hypothetical protein